jgi:indolepyruvate ferredoxin oxidoreductase
VIDTINEYTDRSRNVFVDATRLAEGLFASHLAVNVFLTGVAWQAGLIPLSAAAIEESIRLNRVEAERNLQAFLWGRKYYHDARSVELFLAPSKEQTTERPLIERRVTDLTGYQNAHYAAQYRDFVHKVAASAPELEEPVARFLYKLMAYKDEYEVARLLTKDGFRRQLGEMWEAVDSIGYNLHPPLLRAFGIRKKLQLGEWFTPVLRLLAALKLLRGTPLDPFGYLPSRREERELIAWYRALIEHVLANLTPDNLTLAREIAMLPDQIRGYEDVKRANIAKVKELAAAKQAEMRTLTVASR